LEAAKDIECAASAGPAATAGCAAAAVAQTAPTGAPRPRPLGGEAEEAALQRDMRECGCAELLEMVGCADGKEEEGGAAARANGGGAFAGGPSADPTQHHSHSGSLSRLSVAEIEAMLR
jgi:hypothetical protein